MLSLCPSAEASLLKAVIVPVRAEMPYPVSLFTLPTFSTGELLFPPTVELLSYDIIDYFILKVTKDTPSKLWKPCHIAVTRNTQQRESGFLKRNVAGHPGTPETPTLEAHLQLSPEACDFCHKASQKIGKLKPL